jgi:hypothetical protein
MKSHPRKKPLRFPSWFKNDPERLNAGKTYEQYGTLAYGHDRFKRMCSTTFAKV